MILIASAAAHAAVGLTDSLARPSLVVDRPWLPLLRLFAG